MSLLCNFGSGTDCVVGKKDKGGLCACPPTAAQPSPVKGITVLLGWEAVQIDPRDGIKMAPGALADPQVSVSLQEHAFYKGESQNPNSAVRAANTVWKTAPIN